MQKTCANSWCHAAFAVTSDDLAFYDKVSPVFGGKKESIPPPTLCPECRQQRRLAFRNMRHLYRNTCRLSGVPVITNVSPDKPFPVYVREVWLGDGWDAQAYATPIDANTPFLKQIGRLYRSVPRWSNYIEKAHEKLSKI